MVDANFKSAIYIKNVVELTAITVTPILYLSNGTRYKLPDVNLDPAGTAIIDVNAALDLLGLASRMQPFPLCRTSIQFPMAAAPSAMWIRSTA